MRHLLVPTLALSLWAISGLSAPAQETPAGGALDTGASLGPEVGQIYARETHGDWQVRCVKAPEGQADPCQLFQRMQDEEGNPTADMNFFATPEGAEIAGGATMVAPLESLLPAGVLMAVDGGAPRKYQFAFCDVQGCYARIGFSQAEMDGFRNGSEAKIQLTPAMAPDQTVLITMSLVGFTAGMNALSAAE